MLDFSSTFLKQITLHSIGNKSEGKTYTPAKSLFDFGDELSESLLNYFPGAFKQHDLKKFYHEAELGQNPVYAACQEIFAEKDSFIAQCNEIATHLYDCGISPYISSGELVIAHFSEVIFDGVITDAIGIFKFESKQPFVTMFELASGFDLQFKGGYDPVKIDKGCMVIGSAGEIGYRLLTMNRKKEDDGYWHDHFLGAIDINPSREDTKKYMDLYVDFSTEVAPSMMQKEEQFEFNGAAMDYFGKEDVFDYSSFSNEILEPFRCREQFVDYIKNRDDATKAFYNEPFEVHPEEVKKAKRKLKSIIKLDTHIEVKLHSKDVAEATQFIERGFDEARKMYFYKVFYNREID